MLTRTRWGSCKIYVEDQLKIWSDFLGQNYFSKKIFDKNIF